LAWKTTNIGYISDMTSDSTRRTVIFAGGGTGGHLFPGIAVARELLAREPNARVLFVGSQKPIELEIVRGAGFEHVALPSVSPSLAPTRIVSSLFTNFRAFRQAMSILDRERPTVVVGLGGFASVPPVLAAWRAGVPIVLLEQNVVPGKATRWLSRIANVVCLPWPEAATGLPRGTKTVVTGNPIRREIASLAAPHQPETPARANGPTPSLALRVSLEAPTLLILGGSQGAASLNTAVLDALATLRTELAGWRIVHQTGATDLDAIRQRYGALSLLADVQPFFRDMAEQYRRATCVISRAGATTLAELACAGLPALLVPLPTSAHDHQRLNSQLFANRGAAIVVESEFNDEKCSVANLRKLLAQMLTDTEQRLRMQNSMRNFARAEAASVVLDQVLARAR
jgi:UDP-N-acetylglucosamine--N-acetylmuramyl-(pentapeptide) pyrophosphoryl-undecaprenol N-acetylglucosamine transferase